ncbi:hypothetical protein L1049_008468 [Liquidambar formosana]|uniref:F-box domain-containing protein n=1 Tax=Liquidambar formosana TaxID=63359 RepID=A0AAP0S332_LIQFO
MDNIGKEYSFFSSTFQSISHSVKLPSISQYPIKAESTNKNFKMAQDLLSGLPDEILQVTLKKLPLDDAVKTGVLSRRWKDVWKYISKISIEPLWLDLTGKEIIPYPDHFVCLSLGS